MRREFTKRVRLQIIERAMNENGQIVCEGCGLILGAKRYDIDHIIPDALQVDRTAELTAKDGQLLGVECCHRGGANKTAIDVGRIAKAKRQRIGHLGIRKRSTFACSRDSKFKKKLDGSVVLR